MAEPLYFNLPQIYNAAMQARQSQNQLAMQDTQMQEFQRKRQEDEAIRRVLQQAYEGAMTPGAEGSPGRFNERQFYQGAEQGLAQSGNVDQALQMRNALKAMSKEDLERFGKASELSSKYAGGLINYDNMLRNSPGMTEQARTQKLMETWARSFRPQVAAGYKMLGYDDDTIENMLSQADADPLAAAYGHMEFANTTGKQIYDFLQTSGGYAVGDKTTGKIRAATIEGTGERPMPISADVGLAGSKAGATKTAAERAELKVKREAAFPKLHLANEEFNDQSDLVTEYIDTAIQQARGLVNSGFGSTYLSKIGSTGAKDLAETLTTIRSNIGFDKLQAMRNASPTGGALGQVSDNENKLLQSVLGSVAQDQSANQLIVNLEKIKRRMKKSRENINKAFRSEYGGFLGEQGQPGAGVEQPQVAPAGTKAQLPDGRVVTSDGRGGWN